MPSGEAIQREVQSGQISGKTLANRVANNPNSLACSA